MGSWDGSAASSHSAQFYETEAFLCSSVSKFVSIGLAQGKAVVLCATPSHLESVKEHLISEAVDVRRAISNRQLILLDAAVILNQIMKGSIPDTQAFYQVIGKILRDCSERFPGVRVYGEMVHLLCAEGNYAGALRLEKEWNALGREIPFHLLCGYSMSNFNRDTHESFFHSVCDLHAHVIPTEAYSEISDPEAQRREIARLQQKAVTLEAELEARKRIEAELRRANEDLLRITYVASHDLKEPLREITTFTQLLENRYKEQLDEQGKGFIRYTVDAATRIKNLVEGILQHARMSLEEQPLQVTDFNSAFDEATANLQIALATSGGRVVRDPLPSIKAQPVQVVQLFQNLIGNALKFHNGGVPSVKVTAQKEGGHWIFCVQDNGIGIPEEYKDSIFNLFQRLHGHHKFPGSGIGLATCKKIIDSMGGRIWVESEINKGSKFNFTIPERV